MLPIWLRYFLKSIPAEDIWVLDHNTVDGSTDHDKIPVGVHVKKVYGEKAWMPHHFINRQVELHQQYLFRMGYKCVLFAESDEIIIPDPKIYPGGLSEYFTKFLLDDKHPYVRMHGFEIAHASRGEKSLIEPAIDLSKPVLTQRHYWIENTFFYNKPLLSKVPLRYVPGHHNAAPRDNQIVDYFDNDLLLVHLHAMDFQACKAREWYKFTSSKNNSLWSEAQLGMNRFRKKNVNEFDLLLLDLAFCGKAMLTVSSSNDAQLPPGNVARNSPKLISDLIPDHIRAVII